MKFKKILFILFFSLLFLSGCYNAYAQSTTVQLSGTIPYSYRVRDMYGNLTTVNYGRFIYAENEIAFCVQPGVLVDETASYEINDFQHNQRTLMERIAYVGWHISDQTVEDYLATQFYIWEVLGATIEDTSLSDYNIRKADIQRRLDLLFYQYPSFANSTHNIKATKSITLTDTNDLLSYYSIASKSNGIRVDLNDNQVKIAASNATDKVAYVEFQLIKDEYCGTSMVYQSSSSQSVVPFKMEVNRTFRINLNVEHAKLMIHKISPDYKDISNVSFIVAKDEALTEVIGTYSTDENGLIILERLSPATYYIQEQKVSNNFKLNDKVKKIRVDAGEKVEYECINEYRKIVIEKKDEDGNTVPNVIFAIGTDSTMSNILGTYKTDENGRIELDDVWNKSYLYIQEKSVPSHLQLNNTVYRIKLNPGADTVFYAVNEYSLQELTIMKIDRLGNRYGNVSFKLSTKSDMSEYIYFDENMHQRTDGAGLSTITTKENGEISIFVKPGTYYIQECLVPDNLILNPEIKKLIVKHGHINAIEMVNECRKIILEKQDETGNLIANVTFEIGTSSSMEHILGTFKTGSNGQVQIDDIWNYSYLYIREKKVPSHLQLNDTVYRIKLNPNATTKYIAVNEFKAAPFYIKKTDEDGNPIKNVSFKISRKSDMSEYIYFYDDMHERTDGKGFSTLTSSDTGYCKVYLKPGIYYVQEILAPDGYIVNKEVQSINASLEETNMVRFKNKYTETKIVKKDDQNQFLSNVQFEISTKKDFSQLLKHDGTGFIIDDGTSLFTTNENGEIILKKLNSGTYYLREVLAPQQYYLSNQEVYTLTVEKNKNCEITIINRPRNLVIKKMNEKDEVLVGASFQISKYPDMSNPLLSEEGQPYFITDINGEIVIKGLDNGIYYIQELNAPFNYVLDSTIHQIELKSNQDHMIKLYNTNFQFFIVKKDENNQPLEGAEFIVFDESGKKEILRFTSMTAPFDASTLTMNQTYILREVKAPNGYQKNKDITFVAKHGEVLEVINQPILYSLTINKIDASSKELILNECTFGLFLEKECINCVDTITSKNGIFIFNNLKKGTYYVQEKKAPSGYARSSQVLKVELLENQSILFENHKVIPETGVDFNTIYFYQLIKWMGYLLLSIVMLIFIRKFYQRC